MKAVGLIQPVVRVNNIYTVSNVQCLIDILNVDVCFVKLMER